MAPRWPVTVILAALALGGCVSLSPAVKTVCATCKTVCPYVSLTGGEKTLTCPKPGDVLVIANWAAVEKGAEPIFGCKAAE